MEPSSSGTSYREVFIQGAVLLFSLVMVYAIHAFPKRALANLRNRGRSSLQSKRHFLEGARLLSRARSAPEGSSLSLSLARSALASADSALSADPRDAASLILKALSLRLLRRPSAALRVLDSALSPPASRSLSPRDRSDALLNRAEIHLELNNHRRPRHIDSAVDDLLEAVKICPENSRAFCLLGTCYEQKQSPEDAGKAFDAALRIDPASSDARMGLDRLAKASS